MRKILNACAVLAGVVLLAMHPSVVMANCPGGISQPLNHQFGGYFNNCPDAQPVAGYAYQLGTPTTNSIGFDIVCEVGNVPTHEQGIPCQPEAGVAGDGLVTVNFDWGPFNIPGCPDPSQVSGVGRNVMSLTANDGSGLFLSVAFNTIFLDFLVETAQPDDGAQNPVPLSCAKDNSPQLVSSTAGVQPALTNLCVRVPSPHVFTDCDPTSLGTAFGTCVNSSGGPDTAPPVGKGNVYTKTTNTPCVGPANTGAPDTRLNPPSPGTPWTLAGATDAGGNLCFAAAKPATGCLYVGSTSTVGGVETQHVTGFFSVGDPAAASDKATIKKASVASGKLSVEFFTTAELNTVGFNVVAGGRNLNASLIAAKGASGGGASYTFEVGRGALKNERSLLVQTVLKDGSVVSSAPATISTK